VLYSSYILKRNQITISQELTGLSYSIVIFLKNE